MRVRRNVKFRLWLVSACQYYFPFGDKKFLLYTFLSFYRKKEQSTRLRSQFVTSSSHGGRRYLPYVFTEQAVMGLILYPAFIFT